MVRSKYLNRPFEIRTILIQSMKRFGFRMYSVFACSEFEPQLYSYYAEKTSLFLFLVLSFQLYVINIFVVILRKESVRNKITLPFHCPGGGKPQMSTFIFLNILHWNFFDLKSSISTNGDYSRTIDTLSRGVRSFCLKSPIYVTDVSDRACLCLNKVCPPFKVWIRIIGLPTGY